MDYNKLPAEIQSRIEGLTYHYDKVGESDSEIIIFDDMVLKIEKTCEQSDREHLVLEWLAGKLIVPEIIAFAQKNGYNYLLMSKINDKTVYNSVLNNNADNIVSALADGLKQLWNVNICECDFDSTLNKRLKEARYRIDNNLVDVDDFNEETLGEKGFSDVEELYSFLVKNKPDEDLVFSHGDYCLPNIFSKNNKAVGFIDLGKAGVADRWQDIALCVRSLEYNVCNLKGMSEEEFSGLKEKLYNTLGVTENKEKLRYYILLDELF